jgi:hypothetical protein
MFGRTPQCMNLTPAGVTERQDGCARERAIG